MRFPGIHWTTPKALALAGVSLLAGTALVGVAYGQTPTPTPSPSAPTREQRAEEALSRFAGNLGVDVARVREALKQTALQYVDEALAAGRITQEQATAARTRINSGELGGLGFGLHGLGGPKFGGRGPGGRGGPGGPGELRGVGVGVASAEMATFLGITPEQLRTELNGKSLAQVATAHGKSADAVKAFIVSGSEQRLNAAVTAGRLTQAQATQLLEALRANLDAAINRVHEVRQLPGGAGAGFFFGGGPRIEVESGFAGIY